MVRIDIAFLLNGEIVDRECNGDISQEDMASVYVAIEGVDESIGRHFLSGWWKRLSVYSSVRCGCKVISGGSGDEIRSRYQVLLECSLVMSEDVYDHILW